MVGVRGSWLGDFDGCDVLCRPDGETSECKGILEALCLIIVTRAVLFPYRILVSRVGRSSLHVSFSKNCVLKNHS